jgi:hypothetical protein
MGDVVYFILSIIDRNEMKNGFFYEYKSLLPWLTFAHPTNGTQRAPCGRHGMLLVPPRCSAQSLLSNPRNTRHDVTVIDKEADPIVPIISCRWIILMQKKDLIRVGTVR